jgi:hypothetical protein
MPRNLCIEKPVLAETIYGARENGKGKTIVQRAEVVKLAYKQINPSKSVFDLAYASKQFKAVRDQHIRQLLEDFIRDEPPEEAWKDFCASFRLRRKNGSAGSRVTHVLMNVGTAEEYEDFSKDRSGAWKKAKKGHRGQIVYLLSSKTKKGAIKQSVEVRPVYVFESRGTVERKLQEEFSDAISIFGFFQSGCLISVEREVAHEKKPLPAGTYLLNTIMSESKCMKLTTQNGRTYPDIPRYSLSSLIVAGLRRSG